MFEKKENGKVNGWIKERRDVWKKGWMVRRKN